MYSIKINFGIQNERKIYTNKKELKRAFKNKKEFDKYIAKIEKEVKKG